MRGTDDIGWIGSGLGGGPGGHLRPAETDVRLVHWPLALATVLLGAVGAVMVYSAARGPTADATYGLRQAAFLGIGTIAMVVVGLIDHRRLRRWVRPLNLVSIAALVLVLTPLGTEVRGTQGWFHIAGLALQPSELAKLALILGLAALLDGSWGPDGRPARAGLHPGPIDREPPEAGPVQVAKVLGLLGLFCLLVLAEGETGTVMVYCFVAIGMLAAADVPVRFLALLALSGVAVLALSISAGILPEYQVDRFEAFLDPELDPLGVGYNQRQALTAIGSGGATGAGLLAGPHTQLGSVPDQHTDFIFAAVAEELGLVGSVAIVGLQGLILGQIWLVGRRCRDEWGRLLCAGVFSLLAIAVVQNVAMNLRLAPITGIALPFVSYGGSALVTAMVAVGLVQGVALHQHRRR